MCWEQSRCEKNDCNFPERSDDNRDGADNETKVRAQELLPPNEPGENATCAPALPLPSQPEENRFCLTNSFRNGHIDRGIRQHLQCQATRPRLWCRYTLVTLDP